MGQRTFRDFIEIHSEEVAQEVLGPHLPLLQSCIEDGFRAVAEEEAARPDFHRATTVRTRACMINDQIAHLAETRFHDITGVTISHNRQFLTLTVDEKFEVRFKKLNRKLRASNIQTRKQRCYSLQLRLTGMEEATRVVAGYQIDAYGQSVAPFVTCPNGLSLHWYFPFPDVAGQSILHPTALPDSDSDKIPKVRPKQG
jgi:hypothetical protein